ncbi:bifunctional serine/threonine-protein kinase/phosphatase [Paracoccus aminophilus]|uniref:Calcium-dependent protein kinase SK5 n=1 Tax=Paracoccus aminophilus JCM 7686 TaxID=1367847 RepID=S5Y4F7_PARAH|nr:bifunctional serine/threonine-protein kinase/phosphatase [Paracoccus aminophilus]AGT10615.1 calcium-dependent protein kinase SK5 [Paracoccus aminophilus JCM 7686]
MTARRFTFSSSDTPGQILTVPLLGDLPETEGRKLPNRTMIVTDEAAPGLIWKVTPWASSTLARQEVGISARLDGMPGVVPMFGLAASDAHLIRVMRRSHIGQLDRYLRLNRPTPAEGRRFLVQIAETMARLHGAGIVHRDLKAENILLFEEDGLQALVSDFDRSLVLPEKALIREPAGSLFHMAPELLAGQGHDRKVDVYAFGILIFEIAHNGARPHPTVATGMPDSLTREEFTAEVIENDLRPIWRSEDEDLRILAEACWAKDPAARPEFADIVARLGGTASGAAATALKPAEGVAAAATIGAVRRQMEDTLAVLEQPGRLICGVFDGFRGHQASAFAAWHLPLTLADALDQAPEAVDTAIAEAFARTQTHLARMAAGRAGTTATLAVIEPARITLAWLGDSPAYLAREGAAPELLIRPHLPERADEAARIAAAGGSLRREERMMDSGEMVPWGPQRVYGAQGEGAQSEVGGIALTRALGLPALDPVISPVPEITQIPRPEGRARLILASDGVFEVLNPAAVADLVWTADGLQGAADQIIASALRAGAPDNASLVLIDLDPQPATSGR